MVRAVDELEQGRASYEARAWSHAYEALSRVDRLDPLPPEDLELLATSAYMLGPATRWRHDVKTLPGRLTLPGLLWPGAVADAARAQMNVP